MEVEVGGGFVGELVRGTVEDRFRRLSVNRERAGLVRLTAQRADRVDRKVQSPSARDSGGA